MTEQPATKRYRWLYARLLRLYPEPFRSRFGESMEQTFHDLCRERQAAKANLFIFALGVFVETSVQVLRERMALVMPTRKTLVRLALLTATILCVPLLAMQFSDAVDWTLFDFSAAGALIFGAGFAFESIARRSGNVAYRVAAGLACATALLLIWINLAVGMIGPEGNPANALYLGVLAIGAVGAAAARLRPGGMTRALFATAAAQAVVPILALLIWQSPGVAGGGDHAGLVGVFALNAAFVLLFAASAILFRRAGEAG